MSNLFIYISFGLLMLLMILSSIIYHKFRIWKLIVFLLIAVIYVIMTFFPLWIPFFSSEFVIWFYPYLLYGVVILFAMTFKNKIKITQNLTDYDFFELEKELDEIKSTSELLRLRFIQTIGLLSEGVIFYDEDLNGLFVTDQFLSITKTKENNISLETYVNLIHKDDQASYLQNIKKANKKIPSYDMKYRILRNGTYVWVEETGKVFEFEKKIQIIAVLKGIDIKLFPDTAIHEIDSLPLEPQMFTYLNQIMKETEPFYLVMIHLTNIPDINQRFGREVGNLMIAEYLKKMRYHFAKDINSIFRITGIQFALIIKEQKKYDVLSRALQSGGDLVNLALSIGGIQQIIYPNLGVIKRDPWSTYSMNELVNLSNKALNEAISNPKRNYSVFGE
ncbi:MAG: PAS domain-containing protein [Candidatus Izemoplasmatales bacterium]|nr:PAS domain-containing protein [Candidatus Izemoplasmatales bacterium]